MPGGEAPTALNYQGNIVVPTEAENSGSTSTLTAGTTVTSVSLVPGEYTLNWVAELSGVTPAAADVNNFGLYLGATLLATSANPGTAGEWTQTPLVQLVTANSTLAVKVIATSGSGATYGASISAVPAQTVDFDDPLYPYNPLTADGTSVNITSTPANLATTLAGFDLSEGSECQVFRGSNVPAGSSNFGPVDTTYSVTQAQMLTAPFGQPGSGQYAY